MTKLKKSISLEQRAKISRSLSKTLATPECKAKMAALKSSPEYGFNIVDVAQIDG